MRELKVVTPRQVLTNILDGVQIQFQEEYERCGDSPLEDFELAVKRLTQINLLYPLLEALDEAILIKMVEEIAHV